MKEDLVYLRHKIQKIDEKIQDLFLKRIEYILQVKTIKIKQNLPVEQKNVEKEKKEKLLKRLKNKLYEKEYLELIDKFFDLSKQIQTILYFFPLIQHLEKV